MARTAVGADDELPVPNVSIVNLSEVEVPVFQRAIKEKHVQRMVEHWNPMLFRPPLPARREDGKLNIIDGQQTIEAIRRRGHKAVPAIVREGLAYKVEAGNFADLNTFREGLRPYEIWKAEAEAERP